jgi:hypothetical protein
MSIAAGVVGRAQGAQGARVREYCVEARTRDPVRYVGCAGKISQHKCSIGIKSLNCGEFDVSSSHRQAPTAECAVRQQRQQQQR